MIKSESIDALMQLGFTELEADVYSFLLQESPVTGYRVAQATGRLPGNVYKALESLQSKGAVLIDEAESRMCRAVPSGELLSMLSRKYQEQQSRAAKALAGLKATAEDDRIYQIRSYSQLFERCRAMLQSCEKVAILDVFPKVLEEIREDIEAAAARGVRVSLKVYQDIEIAGINTILNPGADRILQRFPGEWLAICADGGELLVASVVCPEKRVLQAIWTCSATLSYIFTTTLAAEMVSCELVNVIGGAKDLDELKHQMRPFTDGNWRQDPTLYADTPKSLVELIKVFGDDVPGFQTLLRQFSAKT